VLLLHETSDRIVQKGEPRLPKATDRNAQQSAVVQQ